MKLPPFGRTLVAERDAGRHPEKIWVLFGADWGRRPPSSMAVAPADYRPGVYDWSVCAGLPVHVVEREHVEDETRDALRLAVEIAGYTGPVKLHWRLGEEVLPGEAEEARRGVDIAWLCGLPWGSEKDEQAYLAKRRAYVMALGYRALKSA